MKKQMDANPGKWTWSSMTYELMFQNIADLKNDLAEVVGYLPFFWTLLIKFFIPPVILILFGLSCDATNSDSTKVFGHYTGYVFTPYQLLGILCVFFTGFLFLSSLVLPNMYAWLQRPEIEDKKVEGSGNSDEVDEKSEAGPAEAIEVTAEESPEVAGEATEVTKEDAERSASMISA